MNGVPPLSNAAALRADPSGAVLDSPLPLTPLRKFFHGWPRFGGSSRAALSGGYFAGVVATAAPWVVAAIVCLVLGLCANICCGPLRRTKRAARQSAARKRHLAHANDQNPSGASLQTDDTLSSFASPRSVSTNDSYVSAGYKQLLSGVILFNIAFLAVGVCFIANESLREGLVDTLDAISYGLEAVGVSGVGIARFAYETLVRGEKVPEFSNILKQINLFDQDLKKQASLLLRSSERTLDRVRNILRASRIVSILFFTLFVLLYVFILVGLLLLFFIQSEHRRRSTQCAMCLMLVPVTLSWLGVGLVNIAGALASDACYMLNDFHRVVLVQANLAPDSLVTGIDQSKNVFLSNDIQCPLSRPGGSVLTALNPFIGNTVSVEILNAFLKLVYPDKDLDGVAGYTSRVYNELASCETVVAFAGRLTYSVCNHRGPILSLFIMWVLSLGLAVVLTCFFFVAQYSRFDTTRFYTPRFISDSAKLKKLRSVSDPEMAMP